MTTAPTAPAAAPAVAPAAPSPAPSHSNGVQSPLSVEQAHATYTDLVAAGAVTREQANSYMVAEGTPLPDAAATARADAQAQIDRIMGGKDKSFSRAYTDPQNPDHAAAKAKLAALRATVASNTPAAPEPNHAEIARQAGVGPAAEQVEFALIHAPDATPAQRAEASKAANAIVASMGIDPALAQAAVGTVSKSIQSRAVDGRATLMSRAELGQFDTLLQRQWGPAHGAKLAAVRTALASAGQHAAAIKANLLHAAPMAAAMAMNALASHGERLAHAGRR